MHFVSRKTRLVLFFIGFFLITVISVPFLYGLTPRVVLSDSMAPALYTGDLVLVNTHINVHELKVNDIILYYRPEGQFIVIHRIYDIIDDPNHLGKRMYAVKGDGNDQPDFSAESALCLNKKVPFAMKSESINITITYFSQDVFQGKIEYQIPLLGLLFTPLFTYFKPLPALYLIAVVVFPLIALQVEKKALLRSIDLLVEKARIKNIDKKLFSDMKRPYTQYLIFGIIFMNFMVMLGTSGYYNEEIEIQSLKGTGTSIDPFIIGYVEKEDSFDGIFTNHSTISYELQLTVYSNYSMMEITAQGTVIWESMEYGEGQEDIDYTKIHYLDVNQFIYASSDTDDEETHLFSQFILSRNYQNNSLHSSLLVENFYLPATQGQQQSGNQSRAIWNVFYSYNFIQDLMSYTGQATYSFDYETGILLSKVSKGTIKPLIIIDAVYFNVLGILAIYLTMNAVNYVRKQVLQQITEIVSKIDLLSPSPPIDDQQKEIEDTFSKKEELKSLSTLLKDEEKDKLQ